MLPRALLPGWQHITDAEGVCRRILGWAWPVVVVLQWRMRGWVLLPGWKLQCTTERVRRRQVLLPRKLRLAQIGHDGRVHDTYHRERQHAHRQGNVRGGVLLPWHRREEALRGRILRLHDRALRIDLQVSDGDAAACVARCDVTPRALLTLGCRSCSGKCTAGYFCPAGSKSSKAFQCGTGICASKPASCYCPSGTDAQLLVSPDHYTVGSTVTTRYKQEPCPTGFTCADGYKTSSAVGGATHMWLCAVPRLTCGVV